MATAGSLERQAGWRDFDPFRSTWRLLTNVKFAMVLVATAALVGMIGVVIPQLPGEMKGNPAAQSAWFALRQQDFGSFTRPMDRLGLFDVYHQWWFYALWGVIITSVTVCTVSRIRPTVRSIHRPPREVSDAYFSTAHHRAAFELPGEVASLESALRRRHYRVERVRESTGETYLFAERFGWSQYGTFVSHLALIMVLVGGLLTTMAGFNKTLALAETSGAAPIFDTPGSGQIFVGMQNAVRREDAEGNIVDFRSFLEVRRGDEVVDCVATVNDPCTAFGYRFHQAAFYDDLARIEITGPDGRLLYADVLDFNGEKTPAPFITVLRGGTTVFAQAVPQLGSQGGLASSLLAFSDPNGLDISLPIAWQNTEGTATLYLDDGVSGDQPPADPRRQQRYDLRRRLRGPFRWLRGRSCHHLPGYARGDRLRRHGSDAGRTGWQPLPRPGRCRPERATPALAGRISDDGDRLHLPLHRPTGGRRHQHQAGPGRHIHLHRRHPRPHRTRYHLLYPPPTPLGAHPQWPG